MKKALRLRLRERRKKHVKLKIKSNKDRPRLTVFRSAKHIYCQIIDDSTGKTIVSESTLSPAFKEQRKYGGNVKAAALVGSLVGEKAAKQGVKKVCCDRNGFIYAGRLKALADAVREKGIQF